MKLLQKGSRLSITPVREKEFKYIDSLLSYL
jgi:predicted RNA-binding protein with PUA-like domain